MLKEIIIAIQSYYKAHYFIREHKLWKWIIIPGIFYTLLFVVSMYFFGKTANTFIEWLSLKTGLKTWLDKYGTGLLGFLFTVAGIILWLIQMLFYFSLFKYIWLIVGSPVYSYLSEKTDSIIGNKEFAFDSKQLIKDIFRGIKISVRNSFWQSIYMISIILLSLIPIVGWLTPLLALLVECYYYGFSMLDYSFERKKLTSADSIYFISNHKGLAIGNGAVFYIMHILPVIGWVLAPAYAVVAATLSLHEVKDVMLIKTNA
ncbi:MAG TPA: EI24 domain-containing protein [Parafilimonas sp.]|nr:EI24 domain-containing protein [Parafilimonas sp.]